MAKFILYMEQDKDHFKSFNKTIILLKVLRRINVRNFDLVMCSVFSFLSGLNFIASDWKEGINNLFIALLLYRIYDLTRN